MPNAAIYCRISRDTEATGLGVARQEQDCRALAERKGWSVARVFVDNDLSAAGGKRRPQYEALLEAVKAGEVDAVVTWDLDRLHRRPIELEEFFNVCDGAGLHRLATVGGDVDLANGEGMLVARIKGAVAAEEVRKITERVRRKHEELAQKGLAKGGGRRAFGFEPDGMTVVPEEAAMLRDAAERVLAGESLSSICREWGGSWQVTALRKMLMRPRVAGLREYRGEVVGEAAWPAILDRVTWERVRRVLGDPERRGVGGRTRLGSRLLSGMVRCGRCGAKLHLATVHGREGLYYRCRPGPGKGCGGLSAKADAVEAVVAEDVLVALDGPGLAAALAEQQADDVAEAAVAEVEAAEATLADLARDYGAGVVTRAEWLEARRSAEERLNAAQRRLDAARPSAPVLAVLGRPGEGDGGVRAAWAALDLQRRRAVLAAVVDRVVVKQAVRGRNTFDPARVEVVWRA